MTSMTIGRKHGIEEKQRKWESSMRFLPSVFQSSHTTIILYTTSSSSRNNVVSHQSISPITMMGESSPEFFSTVWKKEKISNLL